MDTVVQVIQVQPHKVLFDTLRAAVAFIVSFVSRMLFIATLLAALAIAPLAMAQDKPPFERRVTIDYRAISHELLESVTTEEVRILAPTAISMFGQIRFPLNEHFNDLELLEAETVKADGRRIKVGPDKILLSSLPNAAQMGIFQADVKTRTIVYPDVAVGDTVRYVIKLRSKTAHLPGGFSRSYWISGTTRYADYKVTLDVPDSLNINVSRERFAETVTSTNGRRRYTWSVEPQPFKIEEAGAVSIVDRSPFLIFSSHKNAEAVARWKYEANAPKAEPTAEVRALAEKITAGISDRRDQARAIHDWVTTSIRYFVIWNGQGGYVSHSANDIISNRFGDCKDHTTLTRSLLLAKGIDSDYVYLRAGASTYRDFGEILPVSDHVILYLPEFDLYTDSTASLSAFGVPPSSASGKVAYRIGPKGYTKTRLPLAKSNEHVLKLTVDATLRADGTPVGTAVWSGTGDQAVALRSRMRWTETNGLEQGAVKLLREAKWNGQGAIEARTATDLAEPYIVKTSFDLTNAFFGADKSENNNAIPIGPSLKNRPYAYLATYLDQGRREDNPWRSNSYEATITVRLPEGAALVKVPADVIVSRGGARYSATYRLANHVLTVERRWVLDVSKTTLSKAEIDAIAPVVRAASADAATKLQFTVAASTPKSE